MLNGLLLAVSQGVRDSPAPARIFLRAPGGHPRAPSARLACVITRGKHVSGQAEAEYAADVALAAQFDDLLATARTAEQAFRRAQARALPTGELYPLAKKLDTALTDAMRAAYAAQRAEIGPRGYEDRIYRRKARARSAVHAWTDEAERLLTLRETHRLTGIPPAPRTDLPAGVVTNVVA
jgi:hypothetical protein